MPSILSTKKLKLNQRLLIIRSGISLVEYDAIHIDFIPFSAPATIKNAIFTSQNAVENVFRKEIDIERCFCVGEKTRNLLESKGQRVLKMEEYATGLSRYLVENHKNEFFHFFCGNIRSDEIPDTLKKNNVLFQEIEVYKTSLNPKKFEREFDAILFFSPSGVRSFIEGNTANTTGIQELPEKTKAICIGTTTATEASRFTENILISNTTTIESVIAKAVKTIKI